MQYMYAYSGTPLTCTLDHTCMIAHVHAHLCVCSPVCMLACMHAHQYAPIRPCACSRSHSSCVCSPVCMHAHPFYHVYAWLCPHSPVYAWLCACSHICTLTCVYGHLCYLSLIAMQALIALPVCPCSRRHPIVNTYCKVFWNLIGIPLPCKVVIPWIMSVVETCAYHTGW